MYLRLRQVALVAGELEPVETRLGEVLGLEVCYRDPGVAKYGLHNALFAIGGTFLEVVAPTQADTAAGRYLDRRRGDGGYMFILDCDDLDARRAHFQGLGVRIVEDLRSGDDALWSEAIHLHPRDTGGCLLSVDRHSGGEDMHGGYKWAGPVWQAHDRSRTLKALIGAAIQSDDPEALAARWSALLQRAVVRREGAYEIPLDHGFARFVAMQDDRGEGLVAVHLAALDTAAVLATADRAGVPHGEANGEAWVEIGGVRFVLVG
jgi:hypothetical protein